MTCTAKWHSQSRLQYCVDGHCKVCHDFEFTIGSFSCPFVASFPEYCTEFGDFSTEAQRQCPLTCGLCSEGSLVSVSLKVANINYSELIANPNALAEFKASVKAALAAEANVTIDEID